MKQLHRTLFEGIAWSTASVLAETLDRARTLRLGVAQLDILHDVDGLAAWELARAELFPDSPD